MNDLMILSSPSERFRLSDLASWRRGERHRLDRILLSVLVVFTITTLAGYALFATEVGLRFSARWLVAYPVLAEVYRYAFAFFAQTQIALSAAVLLWHVASRIGWPAFSAFILVAALTFVVEWVGTSTGLPFGEYAYGDALGPKVADSVPLLVPVSWFTVVVPAYALSASTFSAPNSRRSRIVYGAFLVALWDVTLDPAMSGLTGYWSWSESGLFFGIPITNLIGWFATGVALMLLMDFLRAAWWVSRLSLSFMRTYYVLLLALPAGMLLASGVWGPILVTIGLVAAALVIRSLFPSDDAAKAVASNPVNTVSKASASDYFSTHSRSFSFASIAFPRYQRRLVCLVYAFCRITDDIVDEASDDAETVHERLGEWLEKARGAYEGRETVKPWLAELMQKSRDHRVPFSIIEDLVRGVEQDVRHTRLETVDQLNDYCYGVASTVGLWLCHLNDVREPWMLERAAALGRAMQITNIIRDVGEDLGRRRVYIPTEILSRHGLEHATLEEAGANGTIPEKYPKVIDDMISLADSSYEMAWEAIPRLPRGFAVPAAVAAEVYRGIHDRVVSNAYDNLTKRARTSSVVKVWLATKAWFRLRRSQVRLWRRIDITSSALVAAMLITPAATSAAAVGQVDELATLRELYVAAGDDKKAIDAAESIFESMSPAAKADPVIEAFEGAFEVVRAKHAFWPFSKLKHVKRGLPVLDRLVTEYPNQVEIRFLRLVSCYYLPGIMGRKDTVREDLGALCSSLEAARPDYPIDWYRRIVSFVLGASEIGPDCRQSMQEVLHDLNTASTDEAGGTP